MAVKKNTSERLERALSRYNLEALPKETKTALEEAMSRDDFDPDKLAEAIEREEAKHQSTKADDDEHCPWYVALTRILVLLTILTAFFAFFLTLLYAMFLFIDKMLLPLDFSFIEHFEIMYQTHPVMFYSVLAVGFSVFVVWFINHLMKSITDSLNAED
ncbi:MAG: hypothetical protein IJZ42_01645 [Lachnospiraceae bacterium]|nr:hypothetical protein [Lachnospiraceae bacterium]